MGWAREESGRRAARARGQGTACRGRREVQGAGFEQLAWPGGEGAAMRQPTIGWRGPAVRRDNACRS